MERRSLTGAPTSIDPAVNTTISPPSRGILINSSAGAIANVNITGAENGTVILVPLAPGVIHPIEASAVWAAGTTAVTIIVWK